MRRRLRGLLLECMKDEDGINQLCEIEDAVRAHPVFHAQLLYSRGHRRHRARKRHRQLRAFLQIKDRLSEPTPHTFRKAPQNSSRLWVEESRLHNLLSQIWDMLVKVWMRDPRTHIPVRE